MKLSYKLSIVFAFVLLLFIPSKAMAKSLFDDKVVAGGVYTLQSGEFLDGSLLVFGGAAYIQRDATVGGDVVLLGGTVTISGTVEGNVVGIGGLINLEAGAVVEGDAVVIGATLNRDPLARVQGQVITGFQGPITLPLANNLQIPFRPGLQWTSWPTENIGLKILWLIFRTILWALLAALVALILPRPVERTARAIVGQPVLSGGIGLLTAIIAPIVLFILAITCFLLPISLIGIFLFALAWFLGRIALGLEIGQRIGRMFNKEWPLPIATGVGTFILALLVDASGTFIQCIGFIVPLLVGIFGLGGVLLTRFATREYPIEGVIVSTPLESATVVAGEPTMPEAGITPESSPEQADQDKPS